jgi:Ca2+-binding RTX toxin-like protein
MPNFGTPTPGNDLLHSTNQLTDTINGLGGIDTVSYVLATSGVNVSLCIAGPQNTGGSGIDTLIAIENITGSNFADTLQGDSGNNALDGGQGSDFVSYSHATGSVTIDLLGGLATGAAGFDTLFSIENAIGSSFGDTIYGSDVNNVIASGDGNDLIFGSFGSDFIDGGSQSDIVNYSTFAGRITLGAFGVVTKTGLGFPVILGIDQFSSVEVIVATSSNQDTIDLTLPQGSAVSTIVNLFSSSNNVQVNLSGSASGAPAIILSVSQFENVIGSGVADTITGNNIANNLSGNDGNDIISGLGGNDTIDGGNGNDIITGGTGHDKLTGGAGNDSFVFGEVGITNRDTITDFLASQDTIHLKDRLDSILGLGALSTGITGLFGTGTAANTVLSSAKFFRGIGVTGANSSNLAGIYVDTTPGGPGNIFYNDSTAPGSYVIASVGAATALTLTNLDFVYAG